MKIENNEVVMVEARHFGRLDAVAAPDEVVVIGEQVRVSLDTSRVAWIPAGS